MKRTILQVVILLVGCSVCSLVFYRAGFARAKQLQKGTFVISLDALQKLRSGDVDRAMRRMETLCFGSAEMLYSDPAYRDQTITKTLATELIQYRASYRTNSSEWTSAEEQLEKHLAIWK